MKKLLVILIMPYFLLGCGLGGPIRVSDDTVRAAIHRSRIERSWQSVWCYEILMPAHSFPRYKNH